MQSLTPMLGAATRVPSVDLPPETKSFLPVFVVLIFMHLLSVTRNDHVYTDVGSLRVCIDTIGRKYFLKAHLILTYVAFKCFIFDMIPNKSTNTQIHAVGLPQAQLQGAT